MRSAKRGFTLIELVVAIILAVIVIGIAWNMMADQRGNMVSVRQRLRTQAVAREALKTIESEIRIAGFGQQFVFEAGPDGRVDSLDDGAAGLPTCPDISTPNTTSVVASDGASGGNDTLAIAYPTLVTAATGTTCGEILWSRYFVDSDSNLVRVTASTFAGLAASTDKHIVAKGVDVFQIRLAVSGGGTAPLSFLDAANPWATHAAGFSKPNVTVTVGTPVNLVPVAATNWSFLSVAQARKAGERWRDTFTIQPNAAFITDIKAGATLSAGLFNTGAGPSAAMPLLTRPDDDLALSAGGGLRYAIDLVVPANGTYSLGFKGTAKATASTRLSIHGLNASRVGNPPGADWWKNPGAMAATEWSGVKQVEVILLSRTESMDDARQSKFTGLANFVQGAGPVGEFTATDKRLRSVFDHVYPVGNNGTN